MMQSVLKVLQITDLHILPKSKETLLGINTEKYFKQVLKYSLAKQGPFDLILLTGDLAQEPCIASYQRILKILQSSHHPCLCLPGNHDNGSLMRQILNQDLISCDKQLTLKNWQIICLDSQKVGSQGGLLSHQELDYLSVQLQKNQELHTLIAVHHHCINSHSQWMDSMIIENSDELFTIIDSYPQVKAVTCGHIHQVMEQKHHAITVFGSPSTCFQFKPGCHQFALDHKPPGYRILNLFADGHIRSETFWLPTTLNELDFSQNGY